MSDTTEHQADEFEPEAEAPEVETQDAAPEQQQERAPQRVPLAELMQERERRKSLEQELARNREEFQRGNARLEELMQTVRQSVQPQRQAEPVPDINTDPVGFFKHQLEATQRDLEEQKQFRKQFEQQGQQLTQQQQLVAAYQADANAYKEKAPDWDQAYHHFKKTVFDMAVEAGATPEQAMQEMLVQEQRIVTTALHNRKSPAEVVFKTAQRWGYKGEGKADPEARMAAMERGQAAAKTTSGGGSGGARYDNVTVERLANMTPEEFARVPMSIVDKVMGRGA